MSDPAKSPEEIEDVLASIRRLVSDHSPAPDGSMQPIAAEEEAAAAPPIAPDSPVDNRLVLTPSFRVSDPEDPWSPVAEAAETDEADADRSDSDEDTGEVPESLISQLVGAGATEDAGSDTDMPDEDESAAWQPEDRLAQFDDVGADADTDPVEDPGDDSITDEDLADLVVLDGGADAFAAEGGEEDAFESETGDDNWPSAGAPSALMTLVARRDPDADADADLTDAPKMDDDATEDHSAEVASDVPETPEMAQDDAMEAAQDAPEAEADAPEDVTAEDTGEISENAAEAEDNLAQDDPQAEDLGDDPSPFTFPDPEEGVLDEETLREIIVDVVREELQGVLGQRITRNVRKMVRREVRLALAAEDLE
ncbi:hypothetical protein [Hasllibacter sp. MH4015]|uniref:hypothetical protein n=1 Tax=Hasllibacter sp. MH4015 TaxID=2854029 RepID=UPI001CD45CB9|nr:hypothetical protein [Hasllibacter sp. MH4015]